MPASWVVGNATLKDVFKGKKYLKVMSHVHAIAGIIPAKYIVASKTDHYFGWQFCFIGLGLVIFVIFYCLIEYARNN